MISVVLDTNVLVSSLLRTSGNEARITNLVRGSHLRPCLSEPMLMEYESVLYRSKFGFEPNSVRDLLKEVRKDALLVSVESNLSLSPDESDNRFLECAEAAGADYLVTGNLRHFPAVYGVTRVVNAREFLMGFEGSG